MTDYFHDVIGQEKAKRKLTKRLNDHLSNGAILRPMLFLGSTGDGKSYLVRKFARHLPDPSDSTGQRKHKKFVSVNASQIKSPTFFFEDIVPQINDQYATIFIDEAHEIPDKVQALFLTILEVRPEGRTHYTWDDVEYTFDLRKLTWIFATTEGHKVFHALDNRLDKVNLSGYSKNELCDILSLHIGDDIEVADGVLDEMVKYIRRNGRSAYTLAEEVRNTGITEFGLDDWEDVRYSLNLQKHGLNEHEISCLQILREAGEDGLTLGMLASKLAQPGKAVQRTIEPYLLTLGLMEIDGKRRITQAGLDYLTENGYIEPEPETADAGETL